MISENNAYHGVSVFWDFASTLSTSATSAISTYEMVKNIRFGIASYGSLQSIEVYWDFDGCAHSSSTCLRAELSASGVCLIDCPGQGREGAAIKKMLANMIFYAWDHPAPHTFVVITADRDIAYALAMLEIKNHRVVLISPAGTHPDLTSQASVQLDWSRIVLETRPGINYDTKLGDSPSSHMRPCPTRCRKSTFNHPQLPFPRQSNDLPSKERGSAFLKHNDLGFDFFGREDLHLADLTSPKTMGSLGLGAGPLFPRPQSAATASCTISVSCLKDGNACGKEKAGNLPKHIPVRPPSPCDNVSQSTIDLLEHDGPACPAPTSLSDGGQPRKNSESTVESRPASQQSSVSYIDVPAPMLAANKDDGQQLRPVVPSNIYGGTMPYAGRTPPNITLAPTPLLGPLQPVTPAKTSISSTPPLPEKWVPLIKFLRNSNGVAKRKKFMVKLLKDYPQAGVRARCEQHQYVDMAIREGTVTSVLINGKTAIKLSAKYAL